MRAPFPFIAAIIAILLLPGCQTGSRGGRLLSPASSEAESVGILQELRANDTALQNFRAAGTLTLQSPKLKSIQRFPSGTVAYRRPGDLFVTGRNALGVTLFKMTSSGNEFLIEFPTVSNTDERYYYSFEGEQFARVPFSVSPADVARELFMPLDWKTLNSDDVRVTSVDEETGQATLTVTLHNGLTRRCEVSGQPWAISRSTLFDADGATVSEAYLQDYIEVNGVRFPSYAEAWFPTEQTRLTFELRNIRVNTALDDAMFTITWRPGQ